jgi:uncharacterized membrane protein
MTWKIHAVRTTQWLLEHWLFIFLVLFGGFNLLPFLAPVAMRLGWYPVGKMIYWLYFPLCHQMAQRSFFLFGEQWMYSPYELPIAVTGNIGTDTWAFKQFVGSETIGWKVAWSDRMVYMYGGTWLAALIFGGTSRFHRVNRIPWWAFVLLLIPMAVDGGTHMLSDYIGGMFDGFRYTNVWLRDLTTNSLPERFYAGDHFGSFNAWMRLISGLGFGIGLVWLTFPFIHQDMCYNARLLQRKLDHLSPGRDDNASAVPLHE